MKHALLDSELAAIVDVKWNPLDVSPSIIPTHPETCDGLAKTETNCNYIADGMNLCAQHSAQWHNFTACVYTQGLKGDATNRFAKKDTFDQQLGECAEELSDYSADQLRTCTYGEEADKLRAASRTTVAKLFSDYGMQSPGLVWAAVDGQLITDDSTEKGPEVSRLSWQLKLSRAVCVAYKDPKTLPKFCASHVVV